MSSTSTSAPGGPLAGTAIRAARMTDRIGQRQLARQAGLSSGYLSRIESGHVASVSLETLWHVAEVLGRSPLPLAYLGGHMAKMVFIPSTEQSRKMLSSWTADDEKRLDEGDPDDQLLARLGHSLFVENHFGEVLEAFGFGGYFSPLRDLLAWAAVCSDERRRAVLAFANEQAVLSDLDRRQANPADMSVAGIDRDPAAEASYQALMTELRAPGHEKETS